MTRKSWARGVFEADFLGITLEPEASGDLVLHQASYAYALLDRFTEDLAKNKLVTVPAPHESFIGDERKPTTAPKPPQKGNENPKLKRRCQQILGALLWLVTRSRPDLGYAHSRAASYVAGDVNECYLRAVYMLR